MAELNLSRSKAAPRVDLTAMVDLAFLLITFFMLTTSLSKNKSMPLVLPDKTKLSSNIEVPASRTMTILVAGNNKVVWYMGEADKAVLKINEMKTFRPVLLKYKKMVEAKNENKKSLLVIIKPTAKSKYKNFVDIMDELNVIQLTTVPMIDDVNFNIYELEYLKHQRI